MSYKERFEREREWRMKYASTCRPTIIDLGNPCSDCGGSGYKLYGSTATWRSGIGGAMMTEDVCDVCWGSGDTDKPWPSRRRLEWLESLANKVGPEHKQKVNL